MSSFRENLEALGVTEASVADLRSDLTRLPSEIDQAEARAQAARDALAAEKEALASVEKARRDKENELADSEVQREKFQNQTALVKTNTEYTALLHEIEGMTQRISSVEEDILEAMDGADAAAVRLKAAEKEQKENEKVAVGEAEALRRRTSVAEEELSGHIKVRDGLLDELGSEVRTHYEKLAGKLGTAVARITNETCGGCHRTIPPETENRVLAGELNYCANCQRILVRTIE
ncbi:MAG: hypothetical protein GY725_20075 [bacterium]|nr:hypothetical protein [bacterium]